MGIVTRGLAETNRKLDGLANASQVIAKTMPDVARNMRGEAVDAFDHQVDPWGEDWMPPTPRTLARRKERKNSEKALIDTAKLFDSAHVTSTPNTAAITFGEGIDDPRAEANLKGHGKVPPRAFLPIKPDGTEAPPQAYLDRVFAPLVNALKKVFS